jgi:2-polyprenyl-3-methyl-5-hydroxy-6-metoxy-1,4-benzoquinol methylase
MNTPPCEACRTPLAQEILARDCVLLRCPACGHVVRDLERCRAGAREHPWGGNEALDRIRLALTATRLHRLIEGRGPLDVLEVGFGRGILLARLQAEGHRVSGVDRGALELELAQGLQRHAALYAVEAEEAALPDAAFDLVYGIHVVEHLRDPAAVFASWRRALRPGGLAYVMTPNARSAGLSVFRDHWWNLEDPTHVRFFSPRSIALMLAGAGLEVRSIRAPAWDGLTQEVSSLLRASGRGGGEHGVMGRRLTFPLYAAATPLALAARAVWPALRPSMEVVARRPQ